MATTRKFQRAQFSIDSLPEMTFEGFTDGEMWNGWACPYFTHNIARSVLQASQDNGYTWSFEAETDTFAVRHRDDPEDYEPERFEAIRINIENESFVVYGIGAFSWTWENSSSLQT